MLTAAAPALPSPVLAIAPDRSRGLIPSGIPPMPIIALQDVESSQIAAIGHDSEHNVLAIRFKNWKGNQTSLYHYQNFTAEDFEAFRNAESLGRHFGRHIKPFAEKYPFQKIDEMPPIAA